MVNAVPSIPSTWLVCARTDGKVAAVMKSVMMAGLIIDPLVVYA
jgi:hypothetical protein